MTRTSAAAQPPPDGQRRRWFPFGLATPFDSGKKVGASLSQAAPFPATPSLAASRCRRPWGQAVSCLPSLGRNRVWRVMGLGGDTLPTCQARVAPLGEACGQRRDLRKGKQNLPAPGLGSQGVTAGSDGRGPFRMEVSFGAGRATTSGTGLPARSELDTDVAEMRVTTNIRPAHDNGRDRASTGCSAGVRSIDTFPTRHLITTKSGRSRRFRSRYD